MITGRGFDHKFTETIVLIGECALQRCGLTSQLSDVLQASTLCVGLDECYAIYVTYYFNPWAHITEFTKPSPENPLVLEPIPERALIEYIIFLEHFNEGILIEGLKNYAYENSNDFSKLYSMADYYGIKHSLVEHWINEALNDEEE